MQSTSPRAALSFHQPAPSQEAKEALVVSLGFLHPLNHTPTMMGFITLAKTHGDALDIPTILKLQSAILRVDEKIRAGQIDEKQFMQEILTVLGMQKTLEAFAKDADALAKFKKIWNAMQGDLKQVAANIKKLQEDHKDKKIILVSKTSSIHFENLRQELGIKQDSANNPVVFGDIPIYLSYQCPTYQEKFAAVQKKLEAKETADDCLDIGLYEEMLLKEKLEKIPTSLVLQLKSDSPVSKERDEKNAGATAEWAKGQGMYVIERQLKENIHETIKRGFKEKAEQQQAQVARATA